MYGEQTMGISWVFQTKESSRRWFQHNQRGHLMKWSLMSLVVMPFVVSSLVHDSNISYTITHNHWHYVSFSFVWTFKFLQRKIDSTVLDSLLEYLTLNRRFFSSTSMLLEISSPYSLFISIILIESDCLSLSFDIWNLSQKLVLFESLHMLVVSWLWVVFPSNHKTIRSQSLLLEMIL